MSELSRIEIAVQLLEEINNFCSTEELSLKYDRIYKFLIGDYATIKYDEILCKNHKLGQKLLDTYKKDSWLLILLDAYEYLVAIGEKQELTLEQQSLLTKLDSLEFNFTNLYSFFTSPENKNEIVNGIKLYYEYWAKGNDFVKQCRDYVFDNQTEFRNKLTAYVSNIEAMDFISAIFDDLDSEYQQKIDDIVNGISSDEFDVDEYEEDEYEEISDEEFDEDEYNAAVDEMFSENEEELEQHLANFKTELHTKIMDFLEDYLDDKFECDEFIGFFMSFVYEILLTNKQKGKSHKEEEQLLKLFTNDNFSSALIIESFYDNPDYVFAALDTFCRYYYQNDCDILTLRDNVSYSMERTQINKLDEHFPCGKKVENIKLIANPFYEIYDMVYLKFKLTYPDDYAERMYNSLVTQNIDGIFYEFDLEDDINYHRLMMIRYFSRKFIEAVSVVKMNSIPLEQYEAFALLLGGDIDTKEVFKIFMIHGVSIISGYNYLLDKTISEEKQIVKRIYERGFGDNLFKVDPGMISDSLYYRALNDTPLFKYVEANGVQQSIKYLIELSKSDYEQYADYMKEIIASIYCNLKELLELDSVDKVVQAVIESSGLDLDDYFKSLINNESMMYQLLMKYYENETFDDYPKPIEDRIVEEPKVKQKLYPTTNKDNRYS